MITVAGVSFSITIVALTMTSSQFGPRLLRNFMRDTGNQIVLGVFISTFVYCLLVLRSVNSIPEYFFVPRISVTFSLVLTLVSVVVLIYFIHQYGRTSVAVTIRLLEILKTIAEHARSFEQKNAILRQADMITRESQESIREKNDRDDIQERYQALINALNQQTLVNKNQPSVSQI